MSATTTKKRSNIQRDWEDREFVEVRIIIFILLGSSRNVSKLLKIIQLNVVKMVTFLNQFDQTVRYKIAVLNEKITKLENVLDYYESVTNEKGRIKA